MEINKGDIVKSIAGRDKNNLFFVQNIENEYLYLIDGRLHLVLKPKKKKIKHTQFFSSNESKVKEKIINGQEVLDAQVRKELKLQDQFTKI